MRDILVTTLSIKIKQVELGFFGYSSMSNNHFQIANEVSGANVNIITNGGQVQANGREVATKEYVDNLLRSTINVLLTNLGMEDTTLFPEAETLEEL